MERGTSAPGTADGLAEHFHLTDDGMAVIAQIRRGS